MSTLGMRGIPWSLGYAQCKRCGCWRPHEILFTNNGNCPDWDWCKDGPKRTMELRVGMAFVQIERDILSSSHATGHEPKSADDEHRNDERKDAPTLAGSERSDDLGPTSS